MNDVADFIGGYICGTGSLSLTEMDVSNMIILTDI
jgi:hypothetical protein